MVDSQALQKSTSVEWWGFNPKDVELGKEKPMTKKEFRDLPKFSGHYTPVVFKITDPTLLQLPPRFFEEEREDFQKFQVTVFTNFLHNRYWKPLGNPMTDENRNYMNINFQGVEHNDIPKIKMTILETRMLEMAMYHLDWDFTDYPHKPVNKDTYQKYHNWIQRKREELPIVSSEEDFAEKVYPLATKSQMNKILLACEYLHFVEYFRYNNATTFMANPRLVGDYQYWWKNVYTNSVGQKEKDKYQKQKRYLQTAISRIDKDILDKTYNSQKGSVGGVLTDFAIKSYENWLSADLEEDMMYQNKWLVEMAFGKEVKVTK